MWVFLLATKQPPVKIVHQFLIEHGSQTMNHCIVRTDQGGELAWSHVFQQGIADAGFILESTAPMHHFKMVWQNIQINHSGR